MAKVYIVNEGRHDYKHAAVFGELQSLTKGYIARFHLTKMVRTFTEAFKESKEDDFIVVSGPSLMLATACSVFAYKHGRLNLLIWQPDDELGGRYICRKTIL